MYAAVTACCYGHTGQATRTKSVNKHLSGQITKLRDSTFVSCRLSRADRAWSRDGRSRVRPSGDLGGTSCPSTRSHTNTDCSPRK
jgi:hypothetical protein